MPNTSDHRYMGGREEYLAFNSNYICTQSTAKPVTIFEIPLCSTFIQRSLLTDLG